MAAISPVSSPSPALCTKTAGASASRVNAKAPNSSSTVTLATSEMKVVANVPCLRAAKVATVSAEPQHRATTIASRIPARSTVVLSTSFSTHLRSACGPRTGYPIGINLTKSPSNSVGAREVRSGGEGLDGRPRPGPCAHLWRNALTPPQRLLFVFLACGLLQVVHMRSLVDCEAHLVKTQVSHIDAIVTTDASVTS